jgi:hypothetical protein
MLVSKDNLTTYAAEQLNASGWKITLEADSEYAEITKESEHEDE